MDGSFGEIIYIIIMLVIFIFSVFKKKKAEQGDAYDPERDVRSPMDEIFSPFKDVFEEEEAEEEVERKLSTEPPTAPPGRTDLKGAPFVKEDYVFTSKTSPDDVRRQRKSQMPDRPSGLRTEDEEAYDFTTYHDHSEWFDLKKAVIHSEVLKRPDY